MTDLWQEAIDQAELSLRGDTGARHRAASVTVVLSRSPDLFLRSHPGRDLAYLVALLEALGLAEESRALLRGVVAQLQWDPESLALPGDTRNELAVVLVDRGLISAAVGVLSPAFVLDAHNDPGGAKARRVANLASVKLRLGDLTGAMRAAEEALSLGACDDSLLELERMEIRLLAESLLAEGARQQGRHAEADERVHAVAVAARGLVRLLGGDHPKALSALITVARAQFGSALAAGDRDRWEQAADVLSIAAQKVSAVLGPHHSLSRSALVNLATAEFEAAQALDDERRMERARLMLVAVTERSEVERRVSPEPLPPPAAPREADRFTGPASHRGSRSDAGGTAESTPPSPHAPNPPPKVRRPESQGTSATGRVSGSSWGRSAQQHLLSEDREEFERILDEVLRSVTRRPELAAARQRINSEQLRVMALNASAIITAAAAIEYQHFVKVRGELRSSPLSTPSSVREVGRTKPGTNEVGLAATMGEVTESAGAGAGAVTAVLAPVLAGTAAVICLLVGYILKVLSPEQAIAQTMLTAGWVFAAVAAAAILVGAIGLLVVALRSRRSPDTDPYGGDGEEVSRAREAWRQALLERGILPFLREALADPDTAAALHRTALRATASRLPHRGYGPSASRPDEGPAPGARPGFTNPDYSSPDFGGPEQWPE